ncbi:MAG: glycosyltransferase [Candidatus Babeliales bacterium]
MKIRLIQNMLAVFLSLHLIGITQEQPAQPVALEKKRMRILFVVGTFPWYTKQIIINQITGLIDRGHDVYVFAKKQQPNYPISDSLKKYLAHRVYYEELPPDLPSYDIIIFQYGDLGEEFFNLKKEFNLKAKLVTFFRGADATSPREGNEYTILFKEGDIFLTACGYYKYRLALLGCNPKKIFVQHSGIESSQFKFKQREFSRNGPIEIISVGRLTEKKGIPYTLEAIAELMKKYQNINYTIIGDGPHRKRIEKQIEKLNISNKVTLLGWKSQNEIVGYLNKSHIFISPSITTKKGSTDGAINALKEAMLTGIPVISSFHGGIIEIVDHHKSGLLVPERDVTALVEAVTYLLNNPDKCQEMGVEARKKVERVFDMEKLNNKLEELLLNLLKGKRNEKNY